MSLLPVLAESGAAAGPASMALLAVLAQSGAATGPALLAPLAVLAEAGAAAGPATIMAIAVLALLANAPLHSVWRWRRGHFCRNCQILHSTSLHFGARHKSRAISYASQRTVLLYARFKMRSN